MNALFNRRFVQQIELPELGIIVVLTFPKDVSFDSIVFDLFDLKRGISRWIIPLFKSGTTEGDVLLQEIRFREFAMESGEVRQEGVDCPTFHWQALRPWWVESADWWKTPFCGRLLPAA